MALFFLSRTPGVDADPLALSLAALTGLGASGCPNLKDAARVIRGATTGGAVEATEMVPVLLCPGTFAKVLARASFVRGARAAEGILTTATPARRLAARVVRGTISGMMCDIGISRALNDARLLWLPPTVDGLVAVDLPFSEFEPNRSLARREEVIERREPPGVTSGRSVTG